MTGNSCSDDHRPLRDFADPVSQPARACRRPHRGLSFGRAGENFCILLKSGMLTLAGKELSAT